MLIYIAIVWIIQAVIVGFLTATVADAKGRDGTSWFFVGFLVGVFGLVAIVGMPSLKPIRVDFSEETLRSPANPLLLQKTDVESKLWTDARRIPEAVKATAQGYESKKWEVLKLVDDQIREASARMAALGASLEEEFAEKYLMVNDKLYLPALEARLQHKYEEEQVSIRDRTASLSAADAKSSIAEMEDYKSWMIDGMDRMERLRVVLIEPYVGKWLPAHGGIKVTLENGEVILKKGAFRRLFAKENDTI